ncbi:hypothetical protein Pfo_005110 [Paulownia fortunei]|nr:hypothetical protein Pfo_005110 [Paulownia fortunei]
MLLIAITPSFPVAAILQSGLLHDAQLVCWISDSSSTNSQVVDMVLLPDSHFLVVERCAYFTICRYRTGNYSILRNNDCSRLSERLFWISPQYVTFSGFGFDLLSYSFCFSLCLLHREVELPKEVKICNPLPYSDYSAIICVN